MRLILSKRLTADSQNLELGIRQISNCDEVLLVCIAQPQLGRGHLIGYVFGDFKAPIKIFLMVLKQLHGSSNSSKGDKQRANSSRTSSKRLL